MCASECLYCAGGAFTIYGTHFYSCCACFVFTFFYFRAILRFILVFFLYIRFRLATFKGDETISCMQVLGCLFHSLFFSKISLQTTFENYLHRRPVENIDVL